MDVNSCCSPGSTVVTTNQNTPSTGAILSDSGRNPSELGSRKDWNHDGILPVEHYGRIDRNGQLDQRRQNGNRDEICFDVEKEFSCLCVEDQRAMSSHPYFIVAAVHRVALFRWAQLVAVLDYCLEHLLYHDQTMKQRPNETIERLRFFQSCCLGLSRSTYELIEHLESDDFGLQSGISMPPALMPRYTQYRKDLFGDYRYFDQQLRDLSEQCRQESSRLMSQMGVLEATRSLSATRRVMRLTLLAFIFLPLSYVSSIFGMNVDRFSNNPPFWTYWATALPLTLMVVGFALWSEPLKTVQRFIERPSRGITRFWYFISTQI